MKNVLAVHCHYSQGNLSYVPQDVVGAELLPLYQIVLNLLSETASIRIFHDDVYAAIFHERLDEFDQGGALEDAQKLNFVLRTPLVFFIEV